MAWVKWTNTNNRNYFTFQKKIAELQSENDSLIEKLKVEEQKQIPKEKANLVSTNLHLNLHEQLNNLYINFEVFI